MKPWYVIQELNSDNSRTVKEQVIEREALYSNKELFDGFRYCLDSLITFGIKAIPVSVEDGPGLEWHDFLESIEKLRYREVTGNAAIALVNDLMSKATTDQWNDWYRLILIKDLRCGVSEKTINKAVKKARRQEFSIPVFSCQLAQDQKDHANKMIGKKIIDTKMDGARAVTVLYPDGNVQQFSRNGKELDNFDVICEQLSKFAPYIDEPVVLDGEVMSSSFQDLMKQLHRKENVKTDDAKYHIFDFVELKAFTSGNFDVTQIVRRDLLTDFFNIVPQEEIPNLSLVDYEIVDLDTQEGQNRLKKINNLAIANNYEGIMIKDPLAHYECKRSSNWLKMKPFITVDLTVVDFEEGTGKNEGKLGALICEGYEGDKLIKVNVGSGLTDEERETIWKDRDITLGKIVEVKSDVITKAQDGEHYSLRFPVFLGFRYDK